MQFIQSVKKHWKDVYKRQMLFKGTERRTAQQIAAEMDGMGGILNAFTSKE